MPIQQTDIEVWGRRSKTLTRLIADSIERFGGEASFKPVQVTDVLGELEAFRKSLFDTFLDGFFGNGGHGTMPRSRLYPPAYVLDQILSRTAIDFNALVQIHGQRRGILQRVEDDAELMALVRADVLAQAAIQPAIDAGILDERVQAITYFQRMASIRVIPYHPVAMIGVPYTCVEVGRDFLAIPHEAAHYIYWHGSLGAQVPNQRSGVSLPIHLQLDAAFADEPWRRWSEELFADVYGAYIAGPAIALSFQDMQLSFDGNRFYYDDDEHPAPILRPRIYGKVLGRFYPEWAADLDARWNDVLGSVNSLDIETGDGSTMPIDAIISPGTDLDTSKPLDRMIAIILDAAGDLPVPSLWNGYLDSAEKNAPSIYAAFEAEMRALSPNLVPPPIAEPVGIPNRSLAFEALMREAMDASNAAPGEEWWFPLLRANGWTTRGPRGRDE